MLSPADAAVAARDPAVPGLATVLDPDALVAALRAAVPDAPVTAGTATYVRYKPGTSCVVGYRLATPAGPVDAYAKAHRGDDGAKAGKIVDRAVVASPWGPGAARVAADEVVVCSAANDRQLPGTRQLADNDRRRRLIGRLVPDRPGAWRGRLERLRYKPERRYVARLDSPDGPVAVVKCYADPDFAAAEAGLGAFSSDGPLRVPLRWGVSTRRRALAIEWQDGRPLPEIIADGVGASEAVAAVGGALARLHAQPGAGLRRLDRAGEALPLLAAAQSVATVAPDLAGPVRALAVRLAAGLLALPEHRAAIHGDFSADQVLLDGPAVAIIDYDAAAIGDPAADLGLFRANLLRDAVDGRMSRAEAEAFAESLLDGYGTGGRGLRARVDLYTAGWLLRLAAEPFRHRLPDWPDRTATLVRLALEAAAVS